MNKRGSSQPSIWMKIDIKLNENKTTNAHAQQTQNCSKENARKRRVERTYTIEPISTPNPYIIEMRSLSLFTLPLVPNSQNQVEPSYSEDPPK